MIKEIKGNIFNYIEEGDILLHQVNCMGVMGGGIAYTIRQLFPDVYTTYVNHIRSQDDDRDLLGQNLFVQTKYKGKNFTIGNCFGQYTCSSSKQETIYGALCDAFIKAANAYPNSRILIPKNIGCGLAGGDWNRVSKFIESIFYNHEVLLVDFDGSNLN